MISNQKREVTEERTEEISEKKATVSARIAKQKNKYNQIHIWKDHSKIPANRSNQG